MHRAIAELVDDIKGGVNQIVLRTPPGSAMFVGIRHRQRGWSEVIGTIGGDDTVLVILADTKHFPIVKQRFEDMRAS